MLATAWGAWCPTLEIVRTILLETEYCLPVLDGGNGVAQRGHVHFPWQHAQEGAQVSMRTRDYACCHYTAQPLSALRIFSDQTGDFAPPE